MVYDEVSDHKHQAQKKLQAKRMWKKQCRSGMNSSKVLLLLLLLHLKKKLGTIYNVS